jgi:glutaredoxin 3
VASAHRAPLFVRQICADMSQIEIYTTPYCPYCIAAKELLKRKGAAFTEIDVSRDSKRRVEMTKRSNGGYTVPQIFIGTTHVGGCDDLYALDGDGKLDPLLGQASTTGQSA